MKESSVEKTVKADTAEHPPPSDAETSGKEAAGNVVPGPAAEKIEKKKKTKVMRFRMTPGQIERALSVRVGTRPIPTLPEGALAVVEYEDLRDSIRNSMAAATAAVYALRQQMRLDQERIRAQLQTRGYAEYEYEVTDDDEDSGDV